MKSGIRNSKPIRNLFSAVLLTFTLSAQATVIHWTNANNGNWNVAANWLPNEVPSTNDIAVITNSGNYTVTLNINPTIAGLIVGGVSGTQTFATAGRTLTLNGDGLVNANGCLVLSGGALSGTNRLTLTGVMTWQYGAIDTNAAVIVNAGGQVTMASGAKHAKYLYGNMTNGGVITWRPVGSFYIGGTFHNLPGGVFDAQIDGTSILKSGTNAVIVNEGVFRKSAGSRDVSCSVPLLNYSKVDTQIGALILFDGSTLNAGSEFTGAGETQLWEGTHMLNGTIHSTNLVLNGGALAGHGTFSGTVLWISGQLNETASVTVAADGALTFSSGYNHTKLIYGNVTNAGTITWQPLGSMTLGGTIHNLSGALFDAQVDNISILSAGSNAIIINDGVFRKSAGRSYVSCAAPVVNNGIVEILPGELGFDGGCTNLGGTISLLGGMFRMPQPFCLAGGLLTGWGNVLADVTNAGCIRPLGASHVLTIQGKYEQLLSGRMEFELAANDAGTNQSRLNITGAAILNGAIGVIWDDDYAPSPGANFPVLTFSSREGEFCCFDNFILLGRGRSLVPVYNPSSMTLATVATPEPTHVPLRITIEDSVLVCWPVEFSDYELYWSTNLISSIWTLLPGVTNRFLEAPPLTGEKFFLLQKR